MTALRLGALALALVPFGYYATLDFKYHLGPRKPGGPENLVHLLLGVSQLFLVVSAVRASLAHELWALGAIAVLGGIDEFGFHRALPAREHELHARAHFALFIFAVVALGLNQVLDAHR